MLAVVRGRLDDTEFAGQNASQGAGGPDPKSTVSRPKRGLAQVEVTGDVQPRCGLPTIQVRQEQTRRARPFASDPTGGRADEVIEQPSRPFARQHNRELISPVGARAVEPSHRRDSGGRLSQRLSPERQDRDDQLRAKGMELVMIVGPERGAHRAGHGLHRLFAGPFRPLGLRHEPGEVLGDPAILAGLQQACGKAAFERERHKAEFAVC